MPNLNVDRITTLVGLVPSVFVLLHACGVEVPQDAQSAIAAIVVGIVSFYVGKPIK